MIPTFTGLDTKLPSAPNIASRNAEWKPLVPSRPRPRTLALVPDLSYLPQTQSSLLELLDLHPQRPPRVRGCRTQRPVHCRLHNTTNQVSALDSSPYPCPRLSSRRSSQYLRHL